MEKIDHNLVLLELALSAGSGTENSNFDLARLLNMSIPKYIQKLGCCGACVLQSTDQGLQVVYNNNLVEKPWFPLTGIANGLFLAPDQSGRAESCLIIKNELIHYVFNLEKFGLLILSRETQLDKEFHSRLLPVVALLAFSCYTYVEISRQRKMVEKLKPEQNLPDLVIRNTPDESSNIESDRSAIEQTDFNIHELFLRVYAANEYLAEGKNILVQFSVDPAIPEVLNGDFVRLHKALHHLVSNAVRYTQEGKIELHAKLIESKHGTNKILFVVEDTGIGISPENQKTMFNGFQRGDEEITFTHTGAGPGLAISKQLVEIMGGNLFMESTKNIGSSFFFTLEIPTKSVSANETITTADEPKSAPFSGYRFLLVEDNKFNQLITKSVLEIWGGSVIITENGQQAVDILSTEKFDLILMDIQMPVMDGLTASHIIRNTLNLSTPILAITANVVKGIEERCEKAGMQGYLPKPIDKNKLREKIITMIQADQGQKKAPRAIIPEIEASAPVMDEMIIADTSRLLKMVGNDKSMLNRMIFKFLEVTPSYMKELSDADLHHNSDAINRMSHKMKSSIDLVSVNTMRDLIKQINDEAKISGDAENLHEMIKKFSGYFELLVRQLNDIVRMS
jgi:CheY-like chemotaxis protein/HPt (histidine-containing phosphotransfer) domain-containing protein